MICYWPLFGYRMRNDYGRMHVHLFTLYIRAVRVCVCVCVMHTHYMRSSACVVYA